MVKGTEFAHFCKNFQKNGKNIFGSTGGRNGK